VLEETAVAEGIARVAANLAGKAGELTGELVNLKKSSRSSSMTTSGW
jgi:hypothetical protein